MSEGLPDFDRADQTFRNGDDVFVIDANGYDIYKGRIVNVVGDTYAIHYPEYPEDDEEVAGKSRLLVMNDKNIEIFEEQERMRKEIEEENKKSKKRKSNPKARPQKYRTNPKREASKGKKNYV